MKIINRVDDDANYVAYVQKQDLEILSEIPEFVPKSIQEVIKSKIKGADGYDKNDFVEFTNMDEVRFFDHLGWILSYPQYAGASDYFIDSMRERFIEEKDELFKKYSEMSDKQKAKDKDISIRHNLMVYKINTLDEIQKMNHGQSKVVVPLIPDGERSAFTGDANEPHIIRPAIDPNKILLYRKDGKPLADDEQISMAFLQMGMSIAMMERENRNIAGEYEVSRYVSDDNKYLVTEYKLKNYLDDVDQKKSVKEEKGIRKVLNRIFKRGNK